MDEMRNRYLKDIELKLERTNEEIWAIRCFLRGHVEDGDDVGFDLRLRWILADLKKLNDHAKFTSQISLTLLIVAIVHVWRHW